MKNNSCRTLGNCNLFQCKTRKSEIHPEDIKETFHKFYVDLIQKDFQSRVKFLRSQNAKTPNRYSVEKFDHVKLIKYEKIAVTGSNGQLGNCIRKIASDFENQYEFLLQTLPPWM